MVSPFAANYLDLPSGAGTQATPNNFVQSNEDLHKKSA
jgi:hypothetical protein